MGADEHNYRVISWRIDIHFLPFLGVPRINSLNNVSVFKIFNVVRDVLKRQIKSGSKFRGRSRVVVDLCKDTPSRF